MLIILVGSGLAGVFFHYALLMGIKDGTVSKEPSIWTRCILVPALMLAICATVTIEYFFNDVPYLLTLALWVLFVIALEPSYRVVEGTTDQPQTKGSEQ